MIQTKITSCPYCDSRHINKKGVRNNTTRQLQLYRCANCRKYFTPLSGIKTKYSPELIAKVLLLFYQGNTEEEIMKILRSKHKVRLSRRTLGRWIANYKHICTFHPQRRKALTVFSKEKLITTYSFEHTQIYVFKKHEAKVQELSKTLGADGQRLSTYLQTVTEPSFPHSMFQNSQQRSSEVSFETLPFTTRSKQNTANDLATFGLYLAKRSVERHSMIEDFMLAVDGATVATEIPVYLTQNEMTYFQRRGFYLPVKESKQPITGHIDILQIRNGLIYILDYKPDARKINPTNQLLVYTLALASRTRLPLKLFVCAWFDEKDYFEFFPLHAVHTKKQNPPSEYRPK